MSRKMIVRRAEATAHDLAAAMGSMLAPMAAMAFVMGLWAFLSQVAVAAAFPIQDGALGDWRVWMIIAGAVELIAWKVRSRM